jgi:glucokinase
MQGMTTSVDGAVGLDVGGTFLKGARLDGAGRVLARLHEPIDRTSADGLLDQLTRAVRHLESEGGPAEVVGVGLPAIVEARTGRVRRSPNLSILDGLAVGEELTRRSGRPAFAENDANAAAQGEAWLGAGRGARIVFYVTLGTGVGGALVIEGRVYEGATGYAGEIGHVQIDPAGRPCGCGSWGCVETVAGSGGWVARAAEARARRPSKLQGVPLDPEVIVAAAQAGDEVALEVVAGSAHALGIGIAGALNLLNPDRVVIGGGVSAAGPFLLDRVVAEVKLRTFPDVFAAAEFRPAELGGEAGAIGAGRVAMLAYAGG